MIQVKVRNASSATKGAVSYNGESNSQVMSTNNRSMRGAPHAAAKNASDRKDRLALTTAGHRLVQVCEGWHAAVAITIP